MISPISIFSILNLYNLCLDGTDVKVMLVGWMLESHKHIWKFLPIGKHFFIFKHREKPVKTIKQYKRERGRERGLMTVI